jgi:o-succinylbenzoate---CoA ligase
MKSQQLMPNFLKNRAYLSPTRPAIVFQNQTLTFSELYGRVYEIAGKMQNGGITEGQFVAVLLKNHLDTAIILYAFQLLGVKAVILNNRLSGEELIWQLQDCEARILITESTFEEKSDFIKKALTDLFILTKEELRSIIFSDPTIREEIDLNDICTIMYTSGTTGHPKGVIQTYGNHWWSATGSTLNLGLHENDCWLCVVPLFHISGYSILMKSIIYGMKIVLFESFQEQEVLSAMVTEKVTLMSVVSTILNRTVEALKEDEKLPGSFRGMLLGGGPASLSLLQKCVDKGIPVFQSYGMTETASQIVTLSPEESIRKLGSAGKPLFPSQIKILLDEEKAGKPNEHGEIIVKGPNVTPGYLKREQETAEKLKDGWLHTGDMGYIDDEGFLFVLDRRTDLIISGGENIYPAEVEGILTSHEAISDAGVIGMDHSEWGQVPVAFIVKKKPVDEAEIVQFCKQKIASYKVPKKLFSIDYIPRNASKKILRRELRVLLNKGDHHEN